MDSSSNSAPRPITSHSAISASTSSTLLSNSNPTPEQKRKHVGKGPGRGQKRNNSNIRSGRGGQSRRSDLGRSEWSQTPVDRRARNEDSKRQKLAHPGRPLPVYATEFSKEEIEAEERRPKRKVAVMIGYSGSGYKGMQLNNKEKTIEGDLFKAFVAAGAVSKANANDPKKSALVRCARTDKGVHAAGNVISLKLIIEDQNIVEKINSNLTPQIRVWGLERTISSFSAYQRCDSRIYEYLIPTHCFLPPHPKSYLGARLGDLAEEANDLESFKSRQGEVSTFWDEVEVQHIKPILDKLDPSIVPLVLKALYESSDKLRSAIGSERVPEDGEEQIVGPTASALLPEERNSLEIEVDESMIDPARDAKSAQLGSEANVEKHDPSLNCGDHPVDVKCEDLQSKKALSPFEAAIKDIKNAYLIAKKSYRIDRYRLERVRSCLARFVGTHNYHNYTVHKTFGQNSSKRVIKSFDVASEPLLVNGTEWLSLKVHGQSFMMHQIRKMVAMVALIVRSGCPETRIDDSYTASRFIIPKAPGLGLLLERPVFDTYHPQTGQGKIEFVKYEAEMQEFKQREIYDRIFKEEETDNLFHIMCTGVDHLKTGELLYLSSMGEAAVTREGGTSRGVEIEFEGVFSEDEGSEEDS